MHVDTQTLKDVIGNVAATTDGHDVHYEVKDGASLDPTNNTVKTELKQESLDKAHARNDSGVNKEFAQKAGPATPTASKAMNAAVAAQDKASDQYAAMFAKRGLGKALTPKQAPQPTHRGPYASLSPENNAKNPLMRMRQRHFLRLRRTFDQITKRKEVAVNPEMLPQSAKDKMMERALERGDANTPFGPVQKLAEKVMPKASFNIGTWRKWQHALLDGSFIDMPHLKGGGGGGGQS